MENDKEVNKGNEGSKLLRIATSTVFLIIAFICSYLYLQVIIAIMARLFRYTVTLRYNHVSTEPFDYHYWSFSRVLTVFGTAPTICLVTGIFLFFTVLHNSNLSNRFRLFFFWLTVCLINIFLSHLIIAPLGLRSEIPAFYLTFAIVGTWMRLPFAAMAFFAGLAIIITVIWGVVLSKELGAFSYSTRFSVDVKPKVLLAIQLYLVPWLLGSVALLWLSTPANFQPTAIMLLNLGLLGVGIFGRSSTRTAAANMRKRRLFAGAIEMDAIRSMGSKTGARGGEGSLSKFPTVSLIVCIALWLLIYLFLK